MAAEFSQGTAPLTVDHTPSADVAAGQILEIGEAIRIARQDIAAEELGSLVASGAVFKVDKAVGASTAIADGAIVYADITNQIGTTTVGSNKRMGLAVGAAGDNDPFVYVHLGA
ncbi:MAG: DUF2190 family protein [Planctomycetota bacterium]